MKLLLILPVFLAALPVSAADPQPFSPEPLRLEEPFQMRFPKPVLPILEPGGVDWRDFVKERFAVPFIIGPVRIDYGTPLRRGRFEHFNYNMDAPGPGYREQRHKVITTEHADGRNS